MKEKGKSKVFLPILIILLVVVVAVVIYMYSQNPLCVTKSVSNLGNGKYQVTINANVNELNKPKSFIISEILPSDGVYAESSLKPVVNENGVGKISWIFGSIFVPVEDTKIIYSFSSQSGENSEGFFVAGVNADNPEEGYDLAPIGEEETCLLKV